MKDYCLSDESCVPCRGGMPPLSNEEKSVLMLELGADWNLNTEGHLYKEYLFKNFVKTMDFANEITTIAEKEKHHPDLQISWGKCVVEIWTHAIDGLTTNDFILAAKIEKLNTY